MAEETETKEEPTTSVAEEVKKALGALLGSGALDVSEGGETETEEGEAADALPSPRKVEIDTESAVAGLAKSLEIHLHQDGSDKKAEPVKEETPAQSSKLFKFIFGGD